MPLTYFTNNLQSGGIAAQHLIITKQLWVIF